MATNGFCRHRHHDHLYHNGHHCNRVDYHNYDFYHPTLAYRMKKKQVGIGESMILS